MASRSGFPAGAGAAFVSGGTGGVGSVVVRMLADEGVPVVFGYRSSAEAARLLVDEIRSNGGAAQAHAVDLLDPGAVCSLFEGVVAEHGGLRYLVHAAGPHIPMKFLSQVEPEDYVRQLGSDAGTFFTLVHAALPHLRRSGGNVVAVTTSAIAHYGVRDGMSSGTKVAVDQLVRGFAVEEGRFGVRFNLVGPGVLVDGIGGRLMASGEMSQTAVEYARSHTPLGKFGTAADVAEAVLFLASDRAGSLTGQKLNVDNGWSL